MYLVIVENPKCICRYMLQFEEEPTCLKISENPANHLMDVAGYDTLEAWSSPGI